MHEFRRVRFRLQRALPWLFLATSLAVIGLLWWDHVASTRQADLMETGIIAEQVRLRLESWIDDRVAALRYLARAQENAAAPRDVDFEARVGRMLDLYPGFQAINLVDRDGVIRTVVPYESNVDALGRDLHDHPFADVAASFRRAERTGDPTRTSVIELFQGGRGLAVYVPIHDADGGAPRAYVNGVFRVERLVDNCLQEQSLHDRFHVILSETDGTVAWANAPEATTCSEGAFIEGDVRIVDRPWRLHVHLRPAVAAAAAGRLDETFFVGGLVMAVIIALLLRSVVKRQDELRESRAKYKLMVENQAEMVLKTDAEGRLIFVSPSFCRTTGLSEAELLGRGALEMLHPDDHALIVEARREIARPPHNVIVEARTRTREGWVWYSWSGSGVADSHGRLETVIIVGRDVTRRRELENQLRQSQKMQAVGQLAGGIAHDFNNILQSISGSLELAMLDTEPGTQPYEDMEQARASATRAASLTRQLLAFSRRQVLQPSTMDLNKVVDEMFELLQRAVGGDVELKFRPAPEPAPIHADPTQIQQILLNLCVNARDAVRGFGHVTISVRSAAFDADFCAENGWARPGEHVELEVRDDGCGMDDETRALIFEPFFTTKKTTGGTGLGLSTVYGIVEQHEGFIRLESEPGVGTTFHIFFARTHAAPVATAGKTAANPDGGTETVLLAEDDDDVRAFTVRCLESAGYTVLPAADGEDVLNIWSRSRERIDLLLLDVVMPGLGGREVHDRVREDDDEVPILFCSGYDADALHNRFILDEGLELLPKPYDREQLLRRLRQLLDARRPRIDA